MPGEPPTSRWELVRFGLALATALFFVLTVPLAAAKVADFHHLWLGGHLVASGATESLYDPAIHRAILEDLVGPGENWAPRNDRLGAFFYPPHTALAYAALGWLPVGAAKTAMAILSLVAFGASAWLLARLSGGRLHPLWVVVLVGLAPPFFYDYGLGQNATLALAALAAAAVLLASSRDVAAGALVGTLFALKPSWGIAMGWIPVALGRWRATAAMVAAAALTSLVGLAILGPGPWGEYLEVSRGLVILDKLQGYPLENQHNALALARQALGVGAAADALGWGAALALVAATLWRLKAAPASPLTAAALLLLAGAWLNPHLHHYDILVEVVGVVALAAALPRLGRGWRVAAVAAALAWYLSFPLATALKLSFPGVALLALWATLALGTRRAP